MVISGWEENGVSIAKQEQDKTEKPAPPHVLLFEKNPEHIVDRLNKHNILTLGSQNKCYFGL